MVLFAALGLVLALPSGITARAASPSPGMSTSTQVVDNSLASFVSEAAHRFNIPATWIRAVMQVESDDDPDAVSPKGAIGLMQIMPDTYQDMRLRYGLGADPFQPHDNILAGTAYLREMLDCCGMAGFLAAYNAGPNRYDEHLVSGQPLPPETVFYVARITPMLAGTQPGGTMMATALSDWSRAPLFAGHVSDDLTVGSLSPDVQPGRGSAAPSSSALAALTPQSNGMFVSHFGPASP